MKIDLIYNPAEPETTVLIDGQQMERTDIFGFLYPVRSCLLQTWLNPSGSWQGLVHQVRELARGEQAEIVFHGRETDYADVEAAVSGADRIELAFSPWDPLEEYGELFTGLDALLETIVEPEAGVANGESDSPVRKTMRDVFPAEAERFREILMREHGEWIVSVGSEEEYEQADQAALCCCAVTEGYMDSFEKLDRLDGLTRSMRRSPDMICCLMEDDEQRESFAAYAAQYSRTTVRFASEKTPWREMLYEKYGRPFELRQALTDYRRAVELLAQCFGRYDALLLRRRQLSALGEEGEAELMTVRMQLNWIRRKQPYLDQCLECLKRLPAPQDDGKGA